MRGVMVWYAGRLDRLLAWLRAGPVQRTATLVSGLILAGGLVLSWRAHPLELGMLSVLPILGLLVLVLPLLLVLNALEFMAGAMAVGHGARFFLALRIVVIGAAANFLPLPGAALARTEGYKRSGASYSSGSAMVLLQYFVWLALAFGYGGAIAFLFGHGPVGSALLLSGAAAALASLLMATRMRIAIRLFVVIVLLRAMMVVGEAVRIALAFATFGIPATFSQASIVSVSGVLGATVALVPSGLGFTELAASGLSSLIGIGAAAAFLTASLSRLAGLVVTALLAVILTLKRPDSQP